MTVQERRATVEVGVSRPRKDAREKLRGEAQYVGDMGMAGMLHGKVLRSPHAHARIRAIDVSAALELEGVAAILTAADLDAVEPSVAGPKRPQDRVPLPRVWESFKTAFAMEDKPTNNDVARFDSEGGDADVLGEKQHATAVMARPAAHVRNGSVVIAAITSCTNTSNPSVMVAAGLLAKRAVERAGGQG